MITRRNLIAAVISIALLAPSARPLHAQTASPNLSDQQFLAADPTFINRVRQSMITAAIAIKNEGWAVIFHKEREAFVVKVMNTPEAYKVLFSFGVSTDATVLANATSAGAVPLTVANTPARAALVLDASIANAISNQFNSYIQTPAQTQ
jgi:hypothetical protein